MRLLLDTHILVWTALNDKRLSPAQLQAIGDPDNELLVNPVVTYELTQLQKTSRIPLREPIDRLQELIGFELVDLPLGMWRVLGELPDIHRDPLDRLLVAHALAGDLTLVSADSQVRRYPVAII